MERIVYRYNNVKALATWLQRLSTTENIVVLTATEQMSKGLKDKLLSGKSGEFTILPIYDLVNLLQDEWESESVKLQQIIMLNSIIRSFEKQYDKNIMLGFRRNANDVLCSIRMLTEANIYAEDIEIDNNSSLEHSIFKKLWEEFVRVDKHIIAFHSRMNLILSDVNELVKLLRVVIPGTVKKIYLQGFYFITPMQERLFGLLEGIGIELHFLNFYDNQIEYITSIWKDNFSTELGYEAPEKWKEIKGELITNPYTSLFGVKSVNYKNSINIKKYNSDMQFVDDYMKTIDNKIEAELYTCDTNHVDELFKEFKPERYNNRHLLAYPIGQYIYNLHMMWDDFTESIILNDEILEQCFASGWVCLGELQGKEYIYDLRKIKTYFKGCNRISEWKERLNLLRNITKDVISPFEEYAKGKNARWHKMMGNPFLNFSVFSVGAERIQTIITLIEKLIKDAEVLFNSTNEIRLDEHMKRIKDILSSNRSKVELLKEEEVIIKELYERLSIKDSTLSTEFPGDLSQAIMILIGGGFLDSDNYEIMAKKNDGITVPLYQIEASLLKNEKIFLSMCDEECMPGVMKKYTWPLSEQFIDNLNLKKQKMTSRLVHNLKFIMSNNPLCNRFLFYLILCNPDIEISWVAEKNNKQIDTSPYVELIKTVESISIYEQNQNNITIQACGKIDAKDNDNILITDYYDSWYPQEVRMDLELCPYKFLYGYVLDEYPYFESEFHYSFLISSLIASIVSVNGEHKKVEKEVLELFPYLRQVEQQGIIDMAPILKKESNTNEYENISYTNARYVVHYLSNYMKTKVEDIYYKKNSEVTLQESNKIKAEFCMYCQHIGYCRDSIYPIDKGSFDE